MLSPHCPPPAKIKGHLDQKEPVHTDFQVTWIQLLRCTPGQESKSFLAGLQATAIWEGRNNSTVKKLINQAESCLAALNFPSAIC